MLFNILIPIIQSNKACEWRKLKNLVELYHLMLELNEENKGEWVFELFWDILGQFATNGNFFHIGEGC